jgi:hypothetical protein
MNPSMSWPSGNFPIKPNDLLLWHFGLTWLPFHPNLIQEKLETAFDKSQSLSTHQAV